MAPWLSRCHPCGESGCDPLSASIFCARCRKIPSRVVSSLLQHPSYLPLPPPVSLVERQAYAPAPTPLDAAFRSLSLTSRTEGQQTANWNPARAGPPGFGALRGSASFPPLEYPRHAAAAAAAAAVAQHQQQHQPQYQAQRQQHQGGALFIPQYPMQAAAGVGAAMPHSTADTSTVRGGGGGSSSGGGAGGSGMGSSTATATAKVRGLPYLVFSKA